jgi:hypothetical protein
MSIFACRDTAPSQNILESSARKCNCRDIVEGILPAAQPRETDHDACRPLPAPLERRWREAWGLSCRDDFAGPKHVLSGVWNTLSSANVSNCANVAGRGRPSGCYPPVEFSARL